MFQTFKNAWKIPDLRKKMLFTLMIIETLSGVIPQAWWRFFVMAALSALFMGTFIWRYGLTPGEKAFVKSKLKRT